MLQKNLRVREEKAISRTFTPARGASAITSAALRTEIVALLPRLRRFARSLTGNAADADDLVQAGVERALRHLDRYMPGTRLDSWLFKVLKNAWIDEVRGRARRGRVLAPEAEGEHVGDDGLASAEARQQLIEVEAAMRELPEEQRLVIALICVEGLSYAEASEVLDVPVGTLSSRLTRGRETLLARLGGPV